MWSDQCTVETCFLNLKFYVLPEKPLKLCTGFSYIGPKLHNIIAKYIKEAKTTDDLKLSLTDGHGRTSTNLTK